jgi:hypothetical protein
MKTCLTLAFALLLIGTGAALAQTPDGLTPALETVCDAETGAAYGLCNAYCEAMDCELANDSDPFTEPNASATACSKVRTKFQQTTGHDMPCEVSCPCANVPGTFAQVLAGELPVQFCNVTIDREVDAGIGISSTSNRFDYTAVASLSGGLWVCGPAPGGFLRLTPEQGQYCAQLLEQKANSQGVTCETY